MKYFDWNATTPVRAEARRAMDEAMDRFWGNPSTQYRLGAEARYQLDEARERIASLFGVNPESLVFTSGATESNNVVFREWDSVLGDSSQRMGISTIEHPAVREPAKYFGKDRLREFPVDQNGVLDRDVFERCLAEESFGLISVMAANNETGVIQPWEWVLDRCASSGIFYHVDAVQWVGKMPIGKLGQADLISFSAHKFGGPRGVGGLIINPSLRGIKAQRGGVQENDFRGGTENLPAILGMMAALEKANEEVRTGQLTDDGKRAFLERLESSWADDLRVNGSGANTLWNTVSLVMPEVKATRWVAQLDRRGFCVSTGSACSTGKLGPSAVLAGMGLSAEASQRTLRISSGFSTTKADWLALAEAMIEIREYFRNESDGVEVIQIDP